MDDDLLPLLGIGIVHEDEDDGKKESIKYCQCKLQT